MRLLVWLPPLVAVLVDLTTPRLARRLDPRSRALTAAALAVVTSLTVLGSVVILASLGLGRLPWLAQGHWSAKAFASRDPESPFVGDLALLATVIVLIAGLRALTRRLHDLWRVQGVVRAAPDGPVIVLDDDSPTAFAAGGFRGGRIAVSTGMLAHLAEDELGALVAHEEAHLRHRHHWIKLTTGLAASVNPLMRRIPVTVDQACEEWADASAAREIGDPTVVARALARAALVTHRFQAAGATAGLAVGGSVPQRVAVLLDGSPRRSRWPMAVAALVSVLVLAITVDAGTDCLHLFQWAHDVLLKRH